MRLGAILSPVADVGPAVDAARASTAVGLDAVGLRNHYHSAPGVARSRRALEVGLLVADEVNLYGQEAIIDEARRRAPDTPRP